MKVIDPRVTIMLASHMKPNWLPSSLESILAQTRRDIQIIVCDSGEWIGRETDYDAPDQPAAMHQLYQRYSVHPLIEWVTLGQQPRLIERACPYTYAWNRIIESGLIRGRYIAVFTDDDLYRPQFVERMAGYLDNAAASESARVAPMLIPAAVWCSQDRVHEDPLGQRPDPMVIHADHVKTAGWLDHVDITQVMFYRALLDHMNRPVFDESPDNATCRHADGLFLERLAGVAAPVPNIDEVLVTHRYTPVSTYN